MIQILTGDCREVLASLPSDSIPCAVTSPPYDGLRNGAYAGLTWDDFMVIARQLYRVLMPGGVLCWNVNDATVNGSETLTSCKQKIFFAEECSFRIHDTMIWKKLNFSHPESVRYHQIFEYVFILSKGAPAAFNPIKDRPNVMAGKIGSYGANTYTKRNGEKGTRPRYVNTEFGMRYNLWEGHTRGQEELHNGLEHPAMMPKWLARDLILSFSNPGDTILDPMGGSGTTGRAAVELGRKAILIELNPEYAALCHESCNVTPGMF